MSEAERRTILQAAAANPELVAQLAPVVAAGFGVLALLRRADVLTVACFPQANRRAFRRLRDLLGLEIVATPFEERPLYEAIKQAYLREDAALNFPTFASPEFLEDPASAALLGREKVEQLGEPRLLLPTDSVAVCELSYRTSLENLDLPDPGGALPDPGRTRLDLGELALRWARRGDRVALWPGPEGLPAGPLLALHEYRQAEYRRLRGGLQASEHSIRATLLAELPHVVHATEVQLLEVEADGALVFHCDGRRERVRPGAPRRFALAYCFLSYGNRLRRRIEVEVHELDVVPRGGLELLAEPPPWGATHWTRWLDGVGSMSAAQE